MIMTSSVDYSHYIRDGINGQPLNKAELAHNIEHSSQRESAP